MAFYFWSSQERRNDIGAREANRSKRAPTSIATSLGHRLAYTALWDPRHLFGTFSFHPLAGAIFLTIIKIAVSSNRILLVYIS